MNWSDIKGVVGKAAPLLGSLLGPAGASAGGLIASALGVDENPEAVMQAIQQDPQAAVKLQQIEREHERELRRMKIEAETAQITQVNETMRAELKADGWYKSGWRPMIGYVTAFSFAGLMAGLVYALFKEPGKASDIIAEASIVLTAMLTVLGVNITQRSGDKRASIGQNTPGILGSIAERIRKR
ncbi:3TM-type holin [Idiomarina abyssalis]|uniref:3TM-type holin n=1 Tax=Idiomarina abyssalis TaxID=86102 RepID=UPI001CD25EE5|nr:3TM-type holin [Idiomarina abyssalis]